MARIPDKDRLAMIDAHIGHWQQADIQNGSPIEIVAGYGVAQLQADRAAYHAKQEEIAQLESNAAADRANRDAIWGISPDDDNGVWFRLKQYKPMVAARLGARSPLTRTVPNLGRASPQSYVSILHRFIDHWERVNAQIDPDLTLGTFDLASLQTAHDDILVQFQNVEQAEEALLPLARQEREQMFGDEPEELREPTALVSRTLLYHATINAMFPNQPLADSLPEIFPSGGGTTLPTFPFNWSAQPDDSVNTWLENPGLADATQIFLKEGVVEQLQPFDPQGGNLISHNWPDLTVIDDLDQLELLDAAAATIARGTFDAGLAEPT